ncbi:MAG: hypothetical protein JRF33_22865 [Deltaproteobacteria bacterium]|nr:hypothetical protein [Deltaproteobacteria bacterium]
MRPIAILFLALGLAACDNSSISADLCSSDKHCIDLVDLSSDCQEARCVEARCAAVDRESGAPCQLGTSLGMCEQSLCDGLGHCLVQPKDDEAGCDDGDLCTLSDFCFSGQCQSGEARECPSPDPCQIDGQCDPENGRCGFSLLADDTSCDDGRDATHGDHCASGFCRGLNEVDCPAPAPCDAAAPDPGPEDDWRHTSSSVTAALGGAYHRGRDLFLTAADDQWALAKFAYGLGVDKDIHDEDVDMWLLRDCAAWEYLGRARTSEDDEHDAVEGVVDTGGWIFYQIPPEKSLGPGRHRIHFVVRGDLSSTDQIIHVLEPDAKVAVSDVDGTLTTDEYAQTWDVLLNISPDAHPGSAEVMWALSRKGFHLFYLTARPSFLTDRTPEWLAEKGFPPGIVHTTFSLTGATDDAAVEFKSNELRALGYKLGHALSYGFGNKTSDVSAFLAAGMQADHGYYFKLEGDPQGGTVHEDYRTLLETFNALPSACLTE